MIVVLGQRVNYNNDDKEFFREVGEVLESLRYVEKEALEEILALDDQFQNNRCGLLDNFEEKLDDYYLAAENDKDRVFDKECKNALRVYNDELKQGNVEARKMCDSWGEPYRLLGTPGQITVKISDRRGASMC